MALVSHEAQVEARFGPIGDSANLDGSYVHTERTRGSEIVLDAPGGTPRGRASCGMSFWSVRR